MVVAEVYLMTTIGTKKACPPIILVLKEEMSMGVTINTKGPSECLQHS